MQRNQVRGLFDTISIDQNIDSPLRSAFLPEEWASKSITEHLVILLPCTHLNMQFNIVVYKTHSWVKPADDLPSLRNLHDFLHEVIQPQVKC